jgi:hypothetical protein
MEPHGQPTIQAIRNDPYIVAMAQGHCNELEGLQIGINTNINNKKARGLMRAAGEAKHLYTDWPPDFVLVGSDNDRVFYKDLSLEQWSYGYVNII